MRFAILFKLKLLLQTAARGNILRILFTLSVYTAGALCQIGAVASLLVPERIIKLSNSFQYIEISGNENLIKLTAIFFAVLLYWVGEALKLMGRKRSISLMYRYAHNILSAFISRHGQDCLNRQYSAIAFKCATIVRRGLDITPAAMIVLVALTLFLYVSNYTTILTLFLLSVVFLSFQLKLARTSSRLQAQITSNGRERVRKQNSVNIDDALVNLNLNIEKISQVPIGQFISGTYFSLLFLSLLLTENAATIFSPAYIGLILIFGSNVKSSLSGFIVLSRLSAALAMFYDVLTGDALIFTSAASTALSENEYDSE